MTGLTRKDSAALKNRAEPERETVITSIARLYGNSLYDLAAEEKLEEEIKEQMMEMREIFGNYPDFLSLLKEPAVSIKERKKLIDEVFGERVNLYLIHFVKILCEKNLLGEFSGCVEAFLRRYKKDRAIEEGIVESAFPLSEGQMEALEEKFSEMSGKRVKLVQRPNEQLLAGIRVELDGKSYDGTVGGRLAELADKIMKNRL